MALIVAPDKLVASNPEILIFPPMSDEPFASTKPLTLTPPRLETIVISPPLFQLASVWELTFVLTELAVSKIRPPTFEIDPLVELASRVPL